MPKSTHGWEMHACDGTISQFYKRGNFLMFKYFMHNIWKLALFWCFRVIQVPNFLQITKWEWAFLIFKHFFSFIFDMYMPKSKHGWEMHASDGTISQFYKRGNFLMFKYFMHNIWKLALFWCFCVIQVPNFLQITKWEWAFLIFKHFFAFIFDMYMPNSTHFMHGIQASDSLLSQFYKRGKFLTFKYFMHDIWKLASFWCFWIIQVPNFLQITKW